METYAGAAAYVQFVVCLEAIHDGYEIYDDPGAVQLAHDRPDAPVRVPVEIIVRKHVDDLPDGHRLNQARAEHGLFRLDVVRQRSRSRSHRSSPQVSGVTVRTVAPAAGR